jgi:hypothetical protein
MVENQQYGEALTARIRDEETAKLHFRVALMQSIKDTESRQHYLRIKDTFTPDNPT